MSFEIFHDICFSLEKYLPRFRDMKNVIKKTKQSQQKRNNSDFKRDKDFRTRNFKKKIVIWNISDRKKIVKKIINSEKKSNSENCESKFKNENNSRKCSKSKNDSEKSEKYLNQRFRKRKKIEKNANQSLENRKKIFKNKAKNSEKCGSKFRKSKRIF